LFNNNREPFMTVSPAFAAAITRVRRIVFVLPVLAALASVAAPAQAPADPRALLAEQKAAMEKFARMDGVWRGPAWTLLPSGQKHEITQTERIGPFLDGSIKAVEGRGYEPDGRVSFNAFAVISYSPESKSYRIRSHAQGRYGDFAIVPTDDGYTWEVPAGPMTIRYTAVIKDGVLKEVGDRIMPGKEPVRFFEMTLKRLGDSDWPAGGAVPMK
jgi:hypothetical protein